MLSESLLFKMILFLYFKNLFFILTYFNDSIFIEFFFFQNKQKIVQTLLKWLFWTSINLDIIKIKKNWKAPLPPRTFIQFF